MGSRQSSQQGKTFSIDPTGKVTYEDRASEYSPETDIKQRQHEEPSEAQTPVVMPLVVTPIVPEVQAPVSKDLSLEQADEIAQRLKIKYKPADMLGKQRSVFEDIEQRLIECYSFNKNRPLECSHLSEEYKHSVQAQRNHLQSKGSPLKNVPLVSTSLLVIISCLLLHAIQPIACYGAMSVDLGSEWMKVGLVAPSVQMDIVLNAQSQRKTAMAIAFSNGERFVGDTALDVASKYPDRVFTHFLDLLGKTIQDESVKHFHKRFPHANITSHEPNSTSIILNHPDGLQLTPIELLAMMLQHAHDQVVARLDSNEPANDVVITVPPFFNSKEKKVVRDAALLAGLNVLRLTNANSAFALSYGIYRHRDYLLEPIDGSRVTNRTTILFFDQGASQTSATLADYNLVEHYDSLTGKNETLPTIIVRSQAYDRYLGGFDMQLRLRDYLVDEFSKIEKIDKTRIYKRGRSIAKLLKESARVKRILSANTNHVVQVESVIDDRDLRLPITRQKYEELNADYIEERIIKLLDSLFSMPNVSRTDPIDSVIIVGGNTRTPKIQQVLIDYFKLENLGKSVNADEGAALAALYQAASLGRGFRVKKFVLEEFGEIRKQYNPPEVVAVDVTPSTTTAPDMTTDKTTTENGDQSETPTELPSTDDSTTDATTTTTTAATTTTPIPDPDSIYSLEELQRIKSRLDHMREQDFIRLQELALSNSRLEMELRGNDTEFLESLVVAQANVTGVQLENVSQIETNGSLIQEAKEPIEPRLEL